MNIEEEREGKKPKPGYGERRRLPTAMGDMKIQDHDFNHIQNSFKSASCVGGQIKALVAINIASGHTRKESLCYYDGDVILSFMNS